MKLKRSLRDGGVLIGFGVAFYLLTLLVRFFGAPDTDSVSSEISFDRRQAELKYSQKDWETAVIHFAALAKDDPFNGHAWFFLGFSYDSQQLPLYTQVNRERRRTNPDQDKITAWNAELNRIMQQAIPPLKRAIEFPRYRNKARFRLARMHAYHGDHKQAFLFLREALEDGFHSNYRSGIRDGGIFEFSGIRDSEEFNELFQMERVNSQRRRRNRPF